MQLDKYSKFNDSAITLEVIKNWIIIMFSVMFLSWSSSDNKISTSTYHALYEDQEQNMESSKTKTKS